MLAVVIYFYEAHVLKSWLYLPLCEMCPNTESFLVRIFPHLDWIRSGTKYLSVFSSNAGKYGPGKNSFFGHFHAKFSTRKKLKSKYNINYRYGINFKFFCSYCSLLVLHKFWIKFHVSITIMKGFCTQMISFEIWNLEKPFSGFSAFLLTTILVIIFWNLVIKFWQQQFKIRKSRY